MKVLYSLKLRTWKVIRIFETNVLNLDIRKCRTMIPKEKRKKKNEASLMKKDED